MSEWDDAAPVYEQQWETTTSFTVGRLVEWLAPAPGLRFADIACGPGTVAVELASRGAAVDALDLSEAMVARVRERARERGYADQISAAVADAAALGLATDSVDGAVSNFGVIFCPDLDAALHEMVRVTAPGGMLAMSAWSLEARNGWGTLLGNDYAEVLGFELPPRTAYRWSSREALSASLAKAGWADVALETVTFPPTVLATADAVAETLTSPATRSVLVHLSDAQRAALVDYLVAQARDRADDGPLELPREAWIARGFAF